MWPFPNRRKSELPPTPRWVIWGVGLFILLILFSNLRTPMPGQSPLSKGLENIKADLPKVQDYTKFLPDNVQLDREVLTPGNNIPFLCGQRLKIALQAFGAGAPAGGTKTVMVEYGSKEVPPFITQALMGSGGVGSKQRFTFSQKQPLSSIYPEALLNAMVDTVELHVVEAKPDMRDSFQNENLNIQLFDGHVVAGPQAQCGESVKIRLEVWDAEGKQRFSNKQPEAATMDFTIGSNKLMLGVEQAMIGMTKGSTRIAVLPPVWQQVLDAGTSAPGVPSLLRKPQPQIVVVSILRVE